MPRNSLFPAYVALAGVCFLWGTTYLAIKIGVEYVPGFIFAGIRNILAGALTCAFFLLTGKGKISKEVFWILFKRGILLIVIGNAMVHWAEQYISSGLAAIMAAMVPLWMAAFSVLLFKSVRLNRLMIIGLILGFVGIVAIFSDSLDEFANPKYTVGIIAMVAASMGWALGSVYSSLKKIDVNPIYGAGVQMLTAGIISIFIGLGIGERMNPLEMPMNGLWAVLYLAIIGSIVTYNAYMYALSKLSPTRVSIYAYINPVVAVLLGWLILDEKLNLLIGISIMITLLGVYLVNKGFSTKLIKKQASSEEPMSATDTV